MTVKTSLSKQILNTFNTCLCNKIWHICFLIFDSKIFGYWELVKLVNRYYVRYIVCFLQNWSVIFYWYLCHVFVLLLFQISCWSRRSELRPSSAMDGLTLMLEFSASKPAEKEHTSNSASLTLSLSLSFTLLSHSLLQHAGSCSVSSFSSSSSTPKENFLTTSAKEKKIMVFGVGHDFMEMVWSSRWLLD